MKASITAREKQRDILHAEAAVLLHDDQRQALGRRAHDIHAEAIVARAALDRLVRDLVVLLSPPTFHFPSSPAAHFIPLFPSK